jgi:hypothetical protein
MDARRPLLVFAALLLAAFVAAPASAAAAKPLKAPRPVVRLATLEWEPYIGTKLRDEG